MTTSNPTPHTSLEAVRELNATDPVPLVSGPPEGVLDSMDPLRATEARMVVRLQNEEATR